MNEHDFRLRTVVISHGEKFNTEMVLTFSVIFVCICLVLSVVWQCGLAVCPYARLFRCVLQTIPHFNDYIILLSLKSTVTKANNL